MEMSTLVRVEPYSVNRTERIIKAPKLYWSDTGLALYLAGSPEPSGAHFKNVVFHDLLVWRDSDPERPAVLYWRTASDEEVDFVIERQGRVLPIEVKATDNPRTERCPPFAYVSRGVSGSRGWGAAIAYRT